MRALFGVVALLVVLAILGIVATRQLRSVSHSVGASLPPAQSSAEARAAAVPASDVRGEVRQLQQRTVDDINKALEQGAQRNQDADK
ncbi:MAG TPA: hypothetical protein VJ743_12940 [Albitalea sp.]|nr:hypothetical protein [Albitalea sp.]